MKVLAVFSHRPNKVASILPFSGLDYKMVVKAKRWENIPPLLRLILIIPMTLWTILSPFQRLKIRKIIREYKPDILLSHGGAAAYNEQKEAKRAGIKFVLRFGGHVFEEMADNLKNGGILNLVYKAHYWFVKRNLEKADAVLVVTEDMKNRLLPYRDNISVIPVSINILRFEVPKISTKTILTITNLNFMAKVNAMTYYLPAIIMNCGFRYPAYKCIAPGRYHKMFVNYTKEQFPFDYQTGIISILGYQNNVAKEYGKADVFCYFSDLDGCPNVILEAWASHTPVIVNDSDWSRELILNGITGQVVKTQYEAREAISQVLHDKNLQNKLARNGYEYVISHHSEKAAGFAFGEAIRNIK